MFFPALSTRMAYEKDVDYYSSTCHRVAILINFRNYKREKQNCMQNCLISEIDHYYKLSLVFKLFSFGGHRMQTFGLWEHHVKAYFG